MPGSIKAEDKKREEKKMKDKSENKGKLKHQSLMGKKDRNLKRMKTN